jgi:hypothetical protein
MISVKLILNCHLKVLEDLGTVQKIWVLLKAILNIQCVNVWVAFISFWTEISVEICENSAKSPVLHRIFTIRNTRLDIQLWTELSHYPLFPIAGYCVQNMFFFFPNTSRLYSSNRVADRVLHSDQIGAIDYPVRHCCLSIPIPWYQKICTSPHELSFTTHSSKMTVRVRANRVCSTHRYQWRNRATCSYKWYLPFSDWLLCLPGCKVV